MIYRSATAWTVIFTDNCRCAFRIIVVVPVAPLVKETSVFFTPLILIVWG